MKSKLNAKPFLKVLRALLLDIEEILELGADALSGDYEVIAQSIRSRGVEDVLLVQFPLLCSKLESSLDKGYYEAEAGFLTSEGYPRILLPVYHEIFTHGWHLWDEPNPLAVRCLRQVFKTFKKFRVACPELAIKEKILEFKAIEEELPEPTLSWGSDDLLFRGIYPSLSELGDLGFHTKGQRRGQLSAGWGEGGILRDLVSIQHVADKLVGQFRVDWSKFKPKHGPGAVSEQFRESKYEFPSWPERLNKFFPFAKWGVLNELNIPLEIAEYDGSPAKLIDVPKDYKGPRLIASEPIASQFIQQGIMRSLRKSLQKSPLRHCYDPTSQEPSRELVLSSSKDRSFSTIDLSSASDRLSCWTVERIFRRNYPLLELLNAARTPDILYPDGTVATVKKFAAQGAAFTFPIQSITYAIVCMGVIYSSNPTARFSDVAKLVRVFGDDIIVPTEYYHRVCNALEALFLKVNRSKSFSDGFFRESCGMDAYRGTDVSVASILAFFNTRSPLDTVSVVETSNNLYEKGFVRTSATLQNTIPKRIRKDIPLVSPGNNTIMAFVGAGINSELKTRWNAFWHLQEARVLTVESRVIKSQPNGTHSLMQWFTESPPPESVNWTPGEVKCVKARYRLRWVPASQAGLRSNEVRS